MKLTVEKAASAASRPTYSSSSGSLPVSLTDPNHPTQPPPNTVDPRNTTQDYSRDDIDFDLGGGSDPV
ncbi:unnamed protein product [Cochlearia groenlandica]